MAQRTRRARRPEEDEMSYKNLLVHVDDSKSGPGRLRAAAGLAAAHGAHLTGLYVIAEPSPVSFAKGYIAPEILTSVAEQQHEAAEKIMAEARAIVDGVGVPFDSHIERGFDVELPDFLNMHVRYADLAILGQIDPDDEASMRLRPESVALGSGRPALIVPYIGTPDGFGQRILVAWDASREAARAVNDAMPLLERAQTVAVVTVNPVRLQFGHGDEPGADIALHLARHGVKVDVQRIEGSQIDTGNAILSHLASEGSDLLVMGCFAHSRLRELVLGGATRTILEEMTVPVLMSH
jgi:nucleotide-binding universal stress UspA family protein